MCDNDKKLAQALIDFMLTFPMPSTHKRILQEQVTGATFSIEHYDDCFKILFDKKSNIAFPLWTPYLLQSCQVLKNSGPISCQLFVEKGYVVQFEVVDMGLNKIDWDYFWSHDPTFDIQYDWEHIKNLLELEKVNISRFWIGETAVAFALDANSFHHTVQLNGCVIRACPKAGTLRDCKLQINSTCREDPSYVIASADGKIDITCALISLQNLL